MIFHLCFCFFTPEKKVGKRNFGYWFLRIFHRPHIRALQRRGRVSRPDHPSLSVYEPTKLRLLVCSFLFSLPHLGRFANAQTDTNKKSAKTAAKRYFFSVLQKSWTFLLFPIENQKYIWYNHRNLWSSRNFGERPRVEVTLENPAESAGAEGARHKPNLSGKRTEQTK